jgi:hypothetical protein
MQATDWTLLAVLVYAIVALAVAWYAFGLRRASVFEPIGQYLIFVSLFTLPLPVRVCFTLAIEGNVTPQLPLILPYLPVSVVLVAMSLPLFALGYYGRWAGRAADHLPLPVQHGPERSLLAFLVLATLSLFLIYRLTEEAGGVLAFLLLGYGSTEETFGRGHLAIGLPWLFVAAMLLLHRYARRRARVDAVLFAVTLLAVVIVQVLTGNRSMLVYIAIATLVFANYGVRRLRWRFLVPLGVLAFAALNLLGALRGSNYESVADFIERSADIAERVTVDEKEGYFYTLTIGEFVVPIETLPQMVRTVGISEAPWLGVSYARAPLYLIPSFIFPDRPLPLANWYMKQFYGDGYGLNEGRQFFFLAEAYMNFAVAGIVLVALWWGWMWGTLHRWMLRSRGDPSAVLIYALAVAFMFRCIAGDFSTLLAGLSQQSLVAALIGLAIAGTRWRYSRRKVPGASVPLDCHGAQRLPTGRGDQRVKT